MRAIVESRAQLVRMLGVASPALVAAAVVAALAAGLVPIALILAGGAIDDARRAARPRARRADLLARRRIRAPRLRVVLARRAHRNPAGTVTVIVSHRFSTVRAADLAVIHDGRVVETGTHTDLLTRDGRYAAMYRTQAKGYH
jgi:hypothetical protein